ncbi:DinB family protein [Gordonia sp. X0973]|uniref:DinB family protein n=1 Tax=Gordonia sp. X0973 TaxID=2742602 RepID=UPI000F5260E7|nr:DinB family protein [Gordonia sp. X0973]QKT07834.1 DinB family protein [Gordonia sp. X0973]
MATDNKDWSVFAQKRCDECGFDASTVPRAAIAATALGNAEDWSRFLRGPAEDVRARPEPNVWSALEYGAHVRDMTRLFTDRVEAILATDSPEFPGWDQEAAAIAARYDQMDPAIVAEEVSADTARLARVIDGIADDGWDRSGTRDGRPFTAEYLLRYLLHDINHHWYDVAGK